MENFNFSASKRLYDIAVDFRGLDIPVAAQYFYRVCLWLDDNRCADSVTPGAVATLAMSFYTAAGCAERARTANAEEQALWNGMRRVYEKRLKTAWRSIWRVVRDYVKVGGQSADAVMRRVLGDVSKDAEIATLHRFKPRQIEPAAALPLFDLADVGGMEG